MERLAHFMVETQGFYIAFMLLLLFSVFVNRRNSKYTGGRWTRKGRFYFFLGIVIFLFYSSAVLTVEGPVPLAVFPVFAVLILVLGVWLLRRYWNFRSTCAECGGRLDLTGILMDDRNICIDCVKTAEKEARREETPED